MNGTKQKTTTRELTAEKPKKPKRGQCPFLAVVTERENDGL